MLHLPKRLRLALAGLAAIAGLTAAAAPAVTSAAAPAGVVHVHPNDTWT